MIINKNFVIENRKIFFQTQSNIETFKLEVFKYRLRYHALFELHGFDNFELHGWIFFRKLSPVTLSKRTFSYGSKFLKNLSREILVLYNGLKKFFSVFQN